MVRDDDKAYWLAVQGLAVKGILLAVVPIIIYVASLFLLGLVKGDDYMGKKQPGTVVLLFTLRVLTSLSGNMAGSALLANELYH